MPGHILRLHYDGLAASEGKMPTSATKQITNGAQMFLGAHAYYFTERKIPTAVMDHSRHFQIHDVRYRKGSWEALFGIDILSSVGELLGDLAKDAAKDAFKRFVLESYRAWKNKKLVAAPLLQTAQQAVTSPRAGMTLGESGTVRRVTPAPRTRPTARASLRHQEHHRQTGGHQRHEDEDRGLDGEKAHGFRFVRPFGCLAHRPYPAFVLSPPACLHPVAGAQARQDDPRILTIRRGVERPVAGRVGPAGRQARHHARRGVRFAELCRTMSESAWTRLDRAKLFPTPPLTPNRRFRISMRRLRFGAARGAGPISPGQTQSWRAPRRTSGSNRATGTISHPIS